MADFWDSEQTVAEIPKNDRGEIIAVKVVAKGNRRFIDVRNFYINQEGSFAPGKGIALPLDLASGVATQILAAVENASKD